MAEKNTWEFWGEQLFMFGTGGNKFEKTRGGLRRGDLVVLWTYAREMGLDLYTSLWCRLYGSVEESLKEGEGFVYKEDSYRLDKSLV